MLNYRVEGMTCGHCVRAVTEAVHEVDRGARVAVDLRAGAVSVRTDEAGVGERIAEAIRAAGYEASLVGAAA
ncbi:heavy-metal-associated domain-containing protein [Lichenibacterium dinghuense]|jgi:copper chaperone|uniref:heavy-metal-associated domain-containing protein n=1 Tax=Lichenibacterium dinghuense TaxID=2895977 RepID=UPI001F18DF3F|nr:heavy-metal-associated domain-containing protein [Lichenibacterium sp. 6Y81]